MLVELFRGYAIDTKTRHMYTRTHTLIAHTITVASSPRSPRQERQPLCSAPPRSRRPRRLQSGHRPRSWTGKIEIRGRQLSTDIFQSLFNLMSITERMCHGHTDMNKVISMASRHAPFVHVTAFIQHNCRTGVPPLETIYDATSSRRALHVTTTPHTPIHC